MNDKLLRVMRTNALTLPWSFYAPWQEGGGAFTLLSTVVFISVNSTVPAVLVLC